MPKSRSKPDCGTRELTPNQQLVFDWLRKRRAPASAYEILDALRDKGFRAPPQAYRALERLQRLGLVHRVDCLNAFVACCHPDRQHSCEPVVLAVCSECHCVKELSDQALKNKLTGLSSQCDLQPDGLTVELRGRCASCCRQAN
ncbi:MAG: Fur family transcriptional regulator [Burkholderiaceae bacterium]